MAHAKLHMICGNCGCNDDFEWKFDDRSADDEPNEVYIICKNCSTQHSISNNANEVNYDKSASEIELHRLLGRAEALIGLMRDRLQSDESAHSMRLIEGADQWIADLNEIPRKN